MAHKVPASLPTTAKLSDHSWEMNGGSDHLLCESAALYQALLAKNKPQTQDHHKKLWICHPPRVQTPKVSTSSLHRPFRHETVSAPLYTTLPLGPLTPS